MALGYALSITKSRPHLAPLETRNPALAGSSRRETKFQSALTQSASKACARTLSITFGSASLAKPLGAIHRAPFGAEMQDGTPAAYTTSSNGKWVNTWVT